MRTITKTVTLYRYAELSEQARDRVRQNYAAVDGYPHHDEAIATMNKLAEHFGGKVKTWEIDWFNSSCSSMSFDMPEDTERSEIRRRLLQLGKYDKKTLRGSGECKLTGVCCDEDAIDGFRQAFHGGASELTDMMDAAFRSLLHAGQDECEDIYSDETFGEFCEANDLEFYADGSHA